MSDLSPPSAELLPPASTLRERLAIALREVDLLRRLIRAVESVHPHSITTADQLPAPRQGAARGRLADPLPRHEGERHRPHRPDGPGTPGRTKAANGSLRPGIARSEGDGAGCSSGPAERRAVIVPRASDGHRMRQWIAACMRQSDCRNRGNGLPLSQNGTSATPTLSALASLTESNNGPGALLRGRVYC